jgi:hypothetical protein
MSRYREPLTKQDLPWIILVFLCLTIIIGNDFLAQPLSSQEVGSISAFCVFVAAIWIAVRQFGIRLGHTTVKEIGGLLAVTLFFFALVVLAFVFGWCGKMTLIEFLKMQKLPSDVCYPELISSYGLAMLVVALLLCNAFAILYFAIVRAR